MNANRIERLMAQGSAIVGACAIAVLAAGTAFAASATEGSAATGEPPAAVAGGPAPLRPAAKKAPLRTEDDTAAPTPRATLSPPEPGRRSAGAGGPAAGDSANTSNGCAKCSLRRGR